MTIPCNFNIWRRYIKYTTTVNLVRLSIVPAFLCEQIGGSLHDAEIHLVHSRDDTDDEGSELLVVAILLDTNEHGWSVAVSLRSINHGF